MSVRQEVLKTLADEYPYLQEHFGIESLRLFGSVAREEDTEESDIDLLYVFRDGYSTYDNLFDLHEHLSALLPKRIELVSEEWSSTRFLSLALKNAVTISAGEA